MSEVIEGVVEERQFGGLPFPPSPLELTIHNAIIGVQHARLQDGNEIVVAQFYTPQMTITIQFDKQAAEQFSNDIKPSPITIAQVIPK
jgi:hypothetical protein